MLFENGALKYLWTKTMNINNYLVHRLLISTNQGMTPLQVFYWQKPNHATLTFLQGITKVPFMKTSKDGDITLQDVPILVSLVKFRFRGHLMMHPLISLLLWRFSLWIFSLKLMRRICPTYLLQDNNCGVNVSERVGDVLVSCYVPFTRRQISTALDSYCQQLVAFYNILKKNYSFRFLLSVDCCL